MLYVPLELLVFFLQSLDRVDRADRLEENYLALLNFVASAVLQFSAVLVFIQF